MPTLLFLAMALSGQQPGPAPDAAEDGAPSGPVFTTGIELVQVDVVVQRKGKAVDTLTREDFELKDNGKRQDIAVFAVRSVDRTQQRQRLLPPGVVSNWPEMIGDEPVSVTVILMDRQNTKFEDQGYARSEALRYLKNASSIEQMAVYSINQTIKVVQPFTNDRDKLIAGIERSMGETSANLEAPDLVSDLPQNGDDITNAMNRNAAADLEDHARQRRADITRSAFEALAEQLKGMPGRKKVLWVTTALPLIVTEVRSYAGRPSIETRRTDWTLYPAMRLLNEANIVLYGIDPRGGIASLADPGITTMMRLTEMTGGKAIYGRNDIAAAIEEVITDTDVTYTLGFYPSAEVANDRRDGGYHSIDVKVRGGGQVRHREGYQVEPELHLLTPDERALMLERWVRDPLDGTDLGLMAKATRVYNQPDRRAVEVAVNPAHLHLDYDGKHWKGSIDLAIIPETGRGFTGTRQTVELNLNEEELLQILTGGIILANSVKVTGDDGALLSGTLHVVVMDGKTGKFGSVRVPLDQ